MVRTLVTHLLAAAALLSLVGCDRDAPPASSPRSASAPSAALTATLGPDLGPLRKEARSRLVAIGDVHGDLEATKRALRLAGAIDGAGKWIGGDLTVVQTGDQLDRGDGERAILDLLDRLADEAKSAGGALHVLNGNHELMNVALDFRYVTPGGYREFADIPVTGAASGLASLPEEARPRAAAFAPGGPYAKKLAKRHLVVVVEDTVFVHGGILPKHVRYGLAKMDAEVRAWMEGSGRPPPPAVTGDDGPVWNRRYSAAPERADCAVLDEALRAIPARRMVVGHTVQRGGISPACDGKVWRIDVGLAAHYGGPMEVLEIRGDEVKTLREAR